MLEASGIPRVETLLSQTVEHELIPGEKLCRVPELSPALGMHSTEKRAASTDSATVQAISGRRQGWFFT